MVIHDETFVCVFVCVALKGVLTENMSLLLGPLEDGSFHPVQVQSIQRHKSSCRVVRAGQSASLALNIEIPNIRKGMILAAPDLKPQATLYFQVRVWLHLRPG